MRRVRGILWLAAVSLRADRAGTILDVLAATAGAAALLFFVALGLGVGDAARRMFPADARLLEVVPPSVSLGGLLGGGRLDDAAVERLRALPGVAEAWPRLVSRVPVAVVEPPQGEELGWPPGMTLQIPVVGIAPGLVAMDLGGAAFEDPGPGGAPIPVVLSRRLLEVYDRTIAPAWNARRLPAGLSLVGVEAPVRIGLSISPGRTEPRVLDARLRLAGLSDRVPIYAVAVPLGTVARLHQEYGRPDAGYSQVTLLASRPDDVPAVAAGVRRMGFSLDQAERAAAERVGAVVAVTTGALALLSLLMVALAALAVAQSLSAGVRGRIREVAILEALGATSADVRRIVLAQGALVGLLGGGAGALAGLGAARAVDLAASRFLPDLPFRPETLFAFPAWLLALAVLLPALSAVLGALAPAAAAARVDPARAIS
jgi:hypothetical protein